MAYDWQNASRATNDRLQQQADRARELSTQHAREMSRRQDAESRERVLNIDVGGAGSPSAPSSYGSGGGAGKEPSNASYMLWFFALIIAGLAVYAAVLSSAEKPEPKAQSQKTKQQVKSQQAKPKTSTKDVLHTDENCIKWRTKSNGDKLCIGWTD